MKTQQLHSCHRANYLIRRIRRLTRLLRVVLAVHAATMLPSRADHYWVTTLNDGASSTPTINAMAEDGAGGVYVGGSFTSLDGSSTTLNNIARWDGQNWNALNGSSCSTQNGNPNTVRALVKVGSILYLGANASSGNYFASWNGSCWNNIDGLHPGTSTAVLALGTDGTKAYVGGFALYVSSTSVRGVAVYDGSLSMLPNLVGIGGYTDNDVVTSLAVTSEDVFVASVGNTTSARLFKKSGSSWVQVQLPSPGTGRAHKIQKLLVKGNDLYVAGMGGGGSSTTFYNGLARYNITAGTWHEAAGPWSASATGTQINDDVKALAVVGDDLYAGGTMTSGGVTAPLYKLSGGTWSQVSDISGGGVTALAGNSDDLFVGGTFTTAASVSVHGIAKLEKARVTIAAGSDATASETSGNTDTASFVVTRTGPSTSSSALVVNFTLGGDVVAADLYSVSGDDVTFNPTTMSGTVTFPANASASTKTIVITPANDGEAETGETVVASLSTGTGYKIGSSSSATVMITGDAIAVSASASGSTHNGQTWATAYTTIQAGINAATGGQTVVVGNGTYSERINFSGKDITVRAVSGAATIDGGDNGSVVTFTNAESSSALLEGFTIQNGTGSSLWGEAGGIDIRNSSPTIKRCVIASNVGGYGGGGVSVISGSPVFYSCIFQNNSAAYIGGGFCHSVSGVSSLNNCVFIANHADYFGGGMGINANSGGGAGVTVYLYNCTLFSNDSGSNGCSVANYQGTLYIRNSILWDTNTVYAFPTANATHITYSDVYGGWTGMGNINSDPLLSGYSYHLINGSPCIDAGENGGLPATDIDGQTRQLDGNNDSSAVVDMGADEYVLVIPGQATASPNYEGTGIVSVTVYASDATLFAIYRRAPGENDFSFLAWAGGPGATVYYDYYLSSGTYDYYTVGSNALGSGTASSSCGVEVP
jgi:hypothetical protein